MSLKNSQHVSNINVINEMFASMGMDDNFTFERLSEQSFDELEENRNFLQKEYSVNLDALRNASRILDLVRKGSGREKSTMRAREIGLGNAVATLMSIHDRRDLIKADVARYSIDERVQNETLNTLNVRWEELDTRGGDGTVNCEDDSDLELEKGMYEPLLARRAFMASAFESLDRVADVISEKDTNVSGLKDELSRLKRRRREIEAQINTKQEKLANSPVAGYVQQWTCAQKSSVKVKEDATHTPTSLDSESQ